MDTQSEYPRVLICTLTRVNEQDTLNNNLLLRSLFGDWPRDRIAQIHSGESRENPGLCDMNFCLTEEDRRFGSLKAWLKRSFKRISNTTVTKGHGETKPVCQPSRAKGLTGRLGDFLTESGLAEVIFRVRPSKAMLDWIRDFRPDVIFAQGYNLSFTWLPVQLKNLLGVPIAFFTSDDWPSYLYSDKAGLLRITSPLLRRTVAQATRELMAETDCPLAFNPAMAREYQNRYGKEFATIMHSDDPDRFRKAEPIRLCPEEVKSVVLAGGFDKHRWPLLLDIEEACRKLADEGVQVRVTVLTSVIASEVYERLQACKHIEVRSDPGHSMLPSYLKGADVLLVAEAFDAEQAEAIRYSVSTKAHLFMLAQRPIIVYGSPLTGLVQYAEQEGWAHVVDTRNTSVLKSALERLLTDKEYAAQLVRTADEVFERNHDSRVVRKRFLEALRPKQSDPSTTVGSAQD